MREVHSTGQAPGPYYQLSALIFRSLPPYFGEQQDVIVRFLLHLNLRFVFLKCEG